MPTSMLIFFVILVAIPTVGGFGVAMFQRWLQHKEKMSQLIADQTAERETMGARARAAGELFGRARQVAAHAELIAEVAARR